MYAFSAFFKEHSERLVDELIEDLSLQDVAADAEQLQIKRLKLLERCHANLQILAEHIPEEKIDSQPEIITAPPLMETPEAALNTVKKNLISAMEEYKSPPGLYGLFSKRSNLTIADKLIAFAQNELKTDSNNPDECIIALVKLQNAVNLEFANCNKGIKMREKLLAVSNFINQKLQPHLAMNVQNIRPNSPQHLSHTVN